MDAIVIHQYGDRSVLNLEQIATPTPGQGELLVKVFACGKDSRFLRLSVNRSILK